MTIEHGASQRKPEGATNPLYGCYQTIICSLIDRGRLNLQRSERGRKQDPVAYVENGRAVIFIDRIMGARHLLGILRHEISVHLFQLGVGEREFHSILSEFKSQRTQNNPLVMKSYDRVPSSVPDDQADEEALGYFLEMTETEHTSGCNFSDKGLKHLLYLSDRALRMALQGRFDCIRSRNILMASFAGIKSRTADLNALGVAQSMESIGRSSTEVWQESGWFRGADKKWRYEIFTGDAKLKWGQGTSTNQDFFLDWVEEASARDRGVVLSQALDFDGLMSAYPELRRYRLLVDQSGLSGGRCDSESREIAIKDPFQGSKSDAIRVILHELQHAIQHIEGFSQGGPSGSRMWMGEYRPFAEKEYDEILRQISVPLGLKEYAEKAWCSSKVNSDIERAYNNDYLPAHKRSVANNDIIRDAQITAGWNAYKKLAGEVEARNVEQRMEYDMAQRKASPPWETQDIPSQNVYFHGASSEGSEPDSDLEEGPGP